ncbi:MAG: hypothetical protein Ta2B_02610 [Termitinemataceae bacterium]|nr:MAG: hypothetical protein Ta2B_02610 [Termitinemataceae bacterium]
MANWETKRIVDVINDIDDGKFVLPVIQRSLVWTEEKMELLFDTLLKGDSFGGIMVIEEEKNGKPLFSFRPFTKDGYFIPSVQMDKLAQNQYFVIDGQQRLQSFYIGLNGSINGKILFFDLYSDFNKNLRRRAAGYFCSPGELHFGFNTPCYAPEGRGIKPYGSNNEFEFKFENDIKKLPKNQQR